MFKKESLTNGMRILTVPMSGTNTVTVLVLCRTGSDYESRQINGISHFLEHMFFKGTKKRPKPRIINEELDGMGSVYNAFTSREYTGYFIKTSKQHFNHALDILSDIYLNSIFAEDEINKERQVIIEEMHRDRDLPTIHIWWLWESLLYGDQPAGWDVIGTEQTVNSFGQKDFVEYFSHQYVSSNTIVVVAGGVGEQEAAEQVKSFFSDMRGGQPIRSKAEVKERQNSPNALISYKQTDQTHIVLGFRGYPLEHPRRFAAELLGALLGKGFSSRMVSRIREELGLAYAVFSDHDSYTDRGFLVTYVGVAHDNAQKAVQEMLNEYRRVVREPIAESELRRVKDYVKGTVAIELEASNAMANFAGIEELLTQKPLTLDEIFAKIEEVSIEDIQQTARELIRADVLNMVVIGPFKEDKQFRSILETF